MKNCKKDKWDIAQIISQISIPIIIAILGYFINDSIKEKEIRAKYIEFAVDILKSKPSDDTAGLRIWAIDTVKGYSEIPFSKLAIEELKTSSSSYGRILTDENGEILTDEKGSPLTSK